MPLLSLSDDELRAIIEAMWRTINVFEAQRAGRLGLVCTRLSGLLREPLAELKALRASGVALADKFSDEEHRPIAFAALPAADNVRIYSLTTGEWATVVQLVKHGAFRSARGVCVNLSFSGLDDAGAVGALARAVRCGLVLSALHLAYNGMGDVACAALMDALRDIGMARLQTLSLAGNQIGCAGATAVASVLTATGAPELQRMYLGHNPISTVGVEALTAALTKPTVAPKLDYLSIGDVGGAETAELREAMEDLKTVFEGRGARVYTA